MEGEEGEEPEDDDVDGPEDVDELPDPDGDVEDVDDVDGVDEVVLGVKVGGHSAPVWPDDGDTPEVGEGHGEVGAAGFGDVELLPVGGGTGWSPEPVAPVGRPK